MNTINKLDKMFELQLNLNNATNGLTWLEGLTDKGLEINWLRALRYEMVEAIDQSMSWKHWKNIVGTKQYEVLGDTGLHNLKVEIVDGWHFLMSETIKQEWVVNVNKLICSYESAFIKEDKLIGKELVLAIEKIEKLVFKYEDDYTYENFMKIVEQYFKVVFSILTIDELYEMYILKNVLNILRQNNGYKDGSYIKLWGKDKKEDNEFLNDYIQSGEKIDYESIYTYLDNKYKELN